MTRGNKRRLKTPLGSKRAKCLAEQKAPLSRGLCRWFYRTLSVTSSIARPEPLSSKI